MFFCGLEPNYTAALYLRCLPYLQTIYANRNFCAYSFGLLSWKRHSQSQIFYMLYLTWQNLVSSESFSPRIIEWLYLWFNKIVQLLFTKLRLAYPYLRMFWQQNHNNTTWIRLNMWTYVLWFTGQLNVNHIYFIYIARIIWLQLCS